MTQQTRIPTVDYTNPGGWEAFGYSGFAWVSSLLRDYPDSSSSALRATTTDNFYSEHYSSPGSEFSVPTDSTINAVRVVAYMKKNSSAACSVKGRIYVAGSWRDATSQALAESVALHTWEWTTNPATGAAWTVADVNNHAATNGIGFFGWQATDATASYDIFSFLLVVDYTPAGGAAPVLSSPSAGTPGTTTITITATSDLPSDGTMRFLRRVGGSAASATTIASTGESQAATANPQSRTMTGFTAGSTSNYVDMVQVGAGGNSNVVTVGPFTMAAGTTPVAFTGTVPAQTGTVSTAFSTLALAGYFSGTQTPFAYSVFSGSLPPGLSLNSSTGQITGTPTTAGSYSAVVRATDASSNTANTGTISWTIAAAAATTLNLTIAAAAGLTGIRGLVLSAAAPGVGVTVIKAFTDEVFDGSGAMSIDITGLGVLQGQYRWVELTQSNGDPAQSPAPFGAHGPVIAS